MKAVILETLSQPEYKEVDEPILARSDWVKIKVKTVGLCGSDLQKILSYLVKPVSLKTSILGHEFAGQIEEIGSEVDGINIGDRVVATPLVSCDCCEPCREGKKQLCDNIESVGRDLPGAFAEYVLVPSKNVRKISDKLTYEVATLVDPLAVALHCYHLAGSPTNENVLIQGDGAIALCCLRLFHGKNNCVTIIGKHDKNLTVAKNFGGITFNVADIDKLSPDTYDCVIEAVGRNQDDTIKTSVRCVKAGGKVIIAGVFGKGYVGSLPFRDLFYKETVLLGSNSYGKWNGLDEFDYALNILEKNAADYSPIITHILPLEKFKYGIDLVRLKKDSGVIKIVYTV